MVIVEYKSSIIHCPGFHGVDSLKFDRFILQLTHRIRSYKVHTYIVIQVTLDFLMALRMD